MPTRLLPPHPRLAVVTNRLTAVLAVLPLLAACGTSSSSSAGATYAGSSSGPCSYPTDTSAPAARQVDPPPATPTVQGTEPFTITTNVGTLTGSLDASSAPCTVGSFASLAGQHFFDNTPCHRLTTAGIYVLQCGDPTGTGSGGPGYTIPDELSGNETYPAGTVAMANSSAPDTGGSQFFLVYRSSGLSPDYTVFGHLSPGAVKLVAKVAKQGTDNAFGQGDGHPDEKVTITRVSTG